MLSNRNFPAFIRGLQELLPHNDPPVYLATARTRHGGEAVTAVVTARPGATVDGQALIALCKRRLGSVKAPKTVAVWDELPYNDTGKVLKRVISDRYLTAGDR